jgi:AraC-like DNA-binding protein
VVVVAELGSAFAALRRVVAERALDVGRTSSALPGLVFYRADAPFAWQPGQAVSPTIGVVVQGRKRARTGGRTFDYGPGDYFVLTGEMAFEARVVQASPREPYLSLSLSVPCELVVETALELPPVDPVDTSEAWVAGLDDRIADPIRRLVEAVDDPDERRVLVPLAMRELVFLLLRTDAAGALRGVAHDSDDRRRIREAMAYIRSNADARLTVERIARHVGMSASHFAHRFRAIARVSPMRYVKTVRLHRARVVLLRDGARPSEVAQEVGYGSASHFTRDFKSYFGVPPAEWARRTRDASTGDAPRM